MNYEKHRLKQISFNDRERNLITSLLDNELKQREFYRHVWVDYNMEEEDILELSNKIEQNLLVGFKDIIYLIDLLESEYSLIKSLEDNPEEEIEIGSKDLRYMIDVKLEKDKYNPLRKEKSFKIEYNDLPDIVKGDDVYEARNKVNMKIEIYELDEEGNKILPFKEEI
jgi:hypothetical protein